MKKTREIRFRAWDKKNEKFFEPIYEAYKGNLHDINISLGGQVAERTLDICADMKRTDDFILQQYTGLLDKNGKEIYEGDIIKDRYENEVEVVVFGNIGYDGKWNGLTGFALKSWESKHWETHKSNGFYELEYHFEPKELEVIGNIYENKELL